MCVVHAYACVCVHAVGTGVCVHACVCVHAYAYSMHVCIFENVMV